MPQKLFIGRNIRAETKAWLSGVNIRFEDHQLIRIESCKPDYAMFSSLEDKPKMWMISSQWTAKWLVKYHNEIGFGNADSIICLSKKQKEICSDFTQNVSVSNQKNVKSLAKLAFGENEGEQMIYLHGNISNNIFEAELKPPETHLQKVKVYRNLPLQKKMGETFKCYLFFSPSGAISFSESGNNIPRSAVIVAIGPTTALACEEIFHRKVFVSEIQEELMAVQFAVGILKKMEIRHNTN